MCTDAQSSRDKGLCHLRYMVYRLYREARHIPEYCGTPTFGPDTPQHSALKNWAKQGGKHQLATLYAQTLEMDKPGEISKPFENASGGITLDTLKENFARDWDASSKTGGAKWEAICGETIKLRDALSADADPGKDVKALNRLPHNRGWPATREYKELKTDLEAQGLAGTAVCCISETV
ncbi:MAG: hypothetical protein M3O21_01010 [Chloroflexota bacterium]|nr:hypothetical protein [Chloroflexota bacterium]